MCLFHLGVRRQFIGLSGLILAFRHIFEHGCHGHVLSRHGKHRLGRERISEASLPGSLPGAEGLSFGRIRRRHSDLFALFVRTASRAVLHGQLIGLLLRGRRFGRRFLGGRRFGGGILRGGFGLFLDGKRYRFRCGRGRRAARPRVDDTLVAAAGHVAESNLASRCAGAQDRVADAAALGRNDIDIVVGGVGGAPGDLHAALVVYRRLDGLDRFCFGRVIGNPVVADAGICAVGCGAGLAVGPSRHRVRGVPLNRNDGSVLPDFLHDPHVVHIARVFRPVEVHQVARRRQVFVPRVIGHPVRIGSGIPRRLDHRGGNAGLTRDPGNEIRTPRHVPAAEGVLAPVGLAQFVPGDRDHVLSLVAGEQGAVL